MKFFKTTLFVITILISSTQINAQTIYPDYTDGVIYTKLTDNSVLDLDNYISSNPLVFLPFGINAITRPFPMPGTPLDKIYKLEFSNFGLVNDLTTALQLLTDVDTSERAPLYKMYFLPNDFQNAQQWNLLKINAQNAWDVSKGSATVSIAIVDNGVRITHEDLSPNKWVNPGEIAGNGLDDDFNGFVDDINGYDVADKDNNPNPPASITNNSPFVHGTHCAGIAAAATDNGKGISSIGFNSKIISVKCSKDAGQGNTLSNIEEGIYYAMRAGAKVISMSFGSGGSSLTSELLMNQAYSAGIVLLASAGNENTSSAIYPASYANVIGVGSTDANDIKSSFSNFGNNVTVMAPGSNIYSTLAGSNNAYGSLSGTSMACPLVAGLAALVLSRNPGYTPSQVKTYIQNGCENINSLNPAHSGQLGSGRINAANTMGYVGIYDPESLENASFFIFPNPADTQDNLTMKFNKTSSGNGVIRISDIRGKIIREENVNIQSGETVVIANSGNIPSGYYFISLLNNNQISTQKLVVY